MIAYSYLKIQAEEALLAVARKDDLGGQAGDGDVVTGVNIGEDSILAGRNLGRKLDRLSNAQGTLLDGALEVNVLDLFAQVRLGADKTNEAVLDLQQDVGALLDGLLDSSGSLNNKLLASLRGVRGEVDALNLDDIVVVGLGAKLQGRVAGDLEVVLDDDGLVSLNQDAGTDRREAGGEEGDDGRGEPHCEQRSR